MSGARWTWRGFAMAFAAIEAASVVLALGGAQLFGEWVRHDIALAFAAVGLALLFVALAPLFAAAMFVPVGNQVIWRMPAEDIPKVVDAMRPRQDFFLTLLLGAAAAPPLLAWMLLSP